MGSLECLSKIRIRIPLGLDGAESAVKILLCRLVGQPDTIIDFAQNTKKGVPSFLPPRVEVQQDVGVERKEALRPELSEFSR